MRAIHLEADCDGSELCHGIATELATTLAKGYERVSAMELPATLEEWRAGVRTARKRVDRCRRRGYSFRPLARELHEDEIHAINTSASHRQGRPMSSGYLERPSFSPLPLYPCDRHAIRSHGVWSPDGTLVAYIVVYRSGELALVSQILGHDAYLREEIMFLLYAGALERELRVPRGTIVYNRHDSGGPGLREWKERVGLEEVHVSWER